MGLENVGVVVWIGSWVTMLIMGFIWFHPKVFGLMWMEGASIKLEDIENLPKKKQIAGGIFGLVTIGFITYVVVFLCWRENYLGVFLLGLVLFLETINYNLWTGNRASSYLVSAFHIAFIVGFTALASWFFIPFHGGN